MSSIGLTSIPRRASTLASNFMFCPILSTLRSSSAGLRMASASSISHLAFRPRRRPEEISVAGHVAERNVGCLARTDAKAHPHEIRRHLVKPGGLGVDRHNAAIEDARHPVAQRGRVADHRIGPPVDRRQRWRRRTAALRPIAGGGRRRPRRLDHRRLHAHLRRDAPGQRAELHLTEEVEQHLRIGFAHSQRVERLRDRRVAPERHQLARQPDLVGEVDQGLAALGLGDFLGPGQQSVEIAELVDQQRRRLHPDPGRARNVVDAVAGQRLHVHHMLGADPELLDHLLGADAAVLHDVEHLDTAAHQLHQVLVRGDDRDGPARLARLLGVGGDDVVGLEALHLDAGQVEGARRLADQRELRAQVFRRLGPLGLVGGVERVAERVGGMVEDHRHVGGRVGALGVLDHLEDHVAEARHRAYRQPVRLARQRRQRMVGAEDEARSVDQVQPASRAEARHRQWSAPGPCLSTNFLSQ